MKTLPWFAFLVCLLPAIGVAAPCPDAQPLHALGFPAGLGAEPGATRFGMVTREGHSWVRARTDGAGTLGIARSADAASRPVDLRGRFLAMQLRLAGSGRLGGMEIRLGSGGAWNDFFVFEIPLYSDPLFDPLQPGEWLPLTLSFGRARRVGAPDRSQIRWVAWAVRDDTSGPVVVDWAGLAALPEPERGVLSFTFDDGYAEHLAIAGRAKAERDFPGTAYVMPEQIGDTGYLNLDGLGTLRDLGWDVAAHHATPLPEFDDATLEPTLASVRDYLVSHGFETGAGHLAYPLGRHDPERVVPATRRVFETARVAGAGPETLPPADRYRIRAVDVRGGETSPEDLRAIAEDALAHRHWVVLMFHHLVEGDVRHALEYNADDFERGIALIQETGIDVQTVSEVWSAWRCDLAAPATRPAAPASAETR